MNYYTFYIDSAPKGSKFVSDVPGNSPLAAIHKLPEDHPEIAIAAITCIILQTGPITPTDHEDIPV